MTTAADVEEQVFKVLRSLAPPMVIERDHWLLADLKLLSDDASDMIADLERHYRVKIPPPEWATVLTVQDTIDLVTRYVVK